MVIIPSQPATYAPTANSRELQRRIDQTVSEFRRERSGVKDTDVRAALTHSLNTIAGEDPRHERIAGILVAVAVLAAILVAGLVVSIQRSGTDDSTMMVVGIVAGAAGITIAAIRILRRS